MEDIEVLPGNYPIKIKLAVIFFSANVNARSFLYVL
jgi:hypothetical protein